MTDRVRFRALGAALSLALLACSPDDPCDPGYYADHGACYPLDGGGADAATKADSGSEADSGTEVADAQARDYDGFGKRCSKSSECPASAPDCGAPMLALCTRVNCLAAGPDTCPPTWTCLDVTQISPDPAVQSVCVKL